MKAERREETDHSARNETGGFSKTVVLRENRARKSVDAS
jgi:hypothetical protein